VRRAKRLAPQHASSGHVAGQAVTAAAFLSGVVVDREGVLGAVVAMSVLALHHVDGYQSGPNWSLRSIKRTGS
jgi:hypothetical protein